MKGVHSGSVSATLRTRLAKRSRSPRTESPRPAPNTHFATWNGMHHSRAGTRESRSGSKRGTTRASPRLRRRRRGGAPGVAASKLRPGGAGWKLSQRCRRDRAARSARVATAERALLDVASRLALAGGAARVAEALAAVDSVVRLRDLAREIEADPAYPRIGSLAATLSLPVARDLEPPGLADSHRPGP